VQDQTNVWQIDSFHIGTLIMLQVQSFEMKSFWQILNPIEWICLYIISMYNCLLEDNTYNVYLGYTLKVYRLLVVALIVFIYD
jgi:hypothetical protein